MVTKTFVPMACLLLLSGCNQPATSQPSASVTEGEAGEVFAAALSAWQSMDAAKMKALYAPDFVGFDFTLAPLITDRSEWDKVEDAYAAAKIDALKVTEQKIQLLTGVDDSGQPILQPFGHESSQADAKSKRTKKDA